MAGMKISRTLFLALTGAIGGASGCYVETAPPPPPPPPPPRVVYQAPPATQTVTYYYVDRWGRRIATRTVVRKRPAAPVGTATANPTYRPAPPMTGLTGSATEGIVQQPPPVPPGPTVPPPAPTSEGIGCLDTSAGTVPDCNNLHVEPTCGIRSFVIQKCNAYRDLFDPSVATVAVSCMENLSPAQLCNAENTYNCGKHALSEACADNELNQLCSIAATSCRTTAADCTALLSGLNDNAKQQVAKCIATGCHAGLYSCVEGLTSH